MFYFFQVAEEMIKESLSSDKQILLEDDNNQPGCSKDATVSRIQPQPSKLKFEQNMI